MTRPKTFPSRREIARAYGAVLKSIREGTTELTHETLAEKSDTSTGYQSLMERGERCPNLWIFIKNAIALGNDPVLMLSMTLARLRGEI